MGNDLGVRIAGRAGMELAIHYRARRGDERYRDSWDRVSDPGLDPAGELGRISADRLYRHRLRGADCDRRPVRDQRQVEGAFDYLTTGGCQPKTMNGLMNEAGYHGIFGLAEGIGEEFVPNLLPAEGEHAIPTNWQATWAQFSPFK